MQEERFGARDLTYSAWHRRNSTRRFVGIENAQLLAMIDLDCALWVEYEDRDKETVGLIEVAKDVGQDIKPATVTRRLAARCHPVMPAYTLLYRPASSPNPANPDFPDIDQFRLRRIWPEPEREWRILSPQEWAEHLVELRRWSARKLDRERAE